MIDIRLKKKLDKLAKKAAKDLPRGTIVALSGGIDSGLLAAISDAVGVVTVKLPYGPMFDEYEDATKTADFLNIPQLTVELNDEEFDRDMTEAVRIIGRPTTHFSVFPLYNMMRKLKAWGVDDLAFGDGPDESMCGYVRMHKMVHTFDSEIENFEHYGPLTEKMFGKPYEVYARASGKDEKKVKKLMGDDLVKGMCRVEMELTREDIGGVVDKLADSFGIRVHRPWQSKEFDEFAFNLPDDLKIYRDSEVIWGKYLWREVADEYLPPEIVWRTKKMGGPCYPVNEIKGWLKKEGEFGKTSYIKYQRKILGI